MERQVLAILLKVPSEQDMILDTLTPECFADSANQMILRSAIQLREQRTKINPVTVAGILRQSGEYDSLGGAKHRLAELHAETPDASFASEYCEFLQEWAARRALLLALQAAIVSALNPLSSPVDVVERFEQSARIIVRDDRADAPDAITGTAAILSGVERGILSPDKQGLIPTGFAALDARIGGLRASEVTIIAGRPGSGKTALAVSLGHNVGVERLEPCPLFSFEMPYQQIYNREIGWLTKIDHARFERHDKLTDTERRSVKTAIERLKESKLLIEARPGCTLPQFRSRVRRFVDTVGARVIIVDQAGKFRVEMKNRQRTDELSYITDMLKSIAMEFNVALVVLHQVNRGSERNADGRPTLVDLKGSGSFEEDADNVLLCYRPEYYKLPTFENGDSAVNKGDIQIEKFRNGSPGIARLAFLPQFTRWDDVTVLHEAPTEYSPSIAW